MSEMIDFSADPLADAPLTLEQRRIWDTLRAELTSVQAKNAELAEKLCAYEERDTEASVLNRVDFNREVARMLAFDERYGGVSSILYFDFEGVEEAVFRYGQKVVDAALKEISTVLTHNVRTSDVVGRLAPDEFGVLLMRCDNPAAWRKAESLAATLQQATSEIEGQKIEIKIGYGAYTFRDNEDLATGLKQAAQVMTKAKK